MCVSLVQVVVVYIVPLIKRNQQGGRWYGAAESWHSTDQLWWAMCAAVEMCI